MTGVHYIGILLYILGWFGMTPYYITMAHPTKHRLLSNRRFVLMNFKAANTSNEVFVDHLGIIKEPTILKVLHLPVKARSKRSDTTLTIDDPEWKNQWYLYRDPEPSLNVAAAWQVASGKGVIVGIVSDGINKKHEDLTVDKRLSYDFHKNIPRNSDSRGTRMAGVVAASKNHLCGVGVAFDAQVADIRLLEEHASEKVRAKSMIKWLDGVDIYLHSWSKSTDVDPDLRMPTSVEKSIEMGATQGRHGKGAIYVWDTGNNNAENSCAYDPYINNKYTIPISGITKSQDRLKSGTACPAILATAYSQNNDSNDHIVTTSGGTTTSCTDDFGESSAAAAMATGVLALALEANTNLTWRDLQHLLVYTSNAVLLKQRNPKDFVFNGASLLVSNAFGFGLIDAAKLVGMATVWKPVEPAVMCEASTSHGLMRSGSGASLQTSTIQVSPMRCNMNYLEHVEVEFNLTYSSGRGNIKLTLESPSGTRTVLVPGRRGDDRVKTFNWTVLSVQFWGENPSGGWKLSLQESPSSKFSAGTALLFGWSLKFHGLVNHLEVPQVFPKLSPNLATKITKEEVVDTGSGNSALNFPTGGRSFLPWWFWMIVGIICLLALVGLVVFLRQRFCKQRFRNSEEGKTEEETESLHQDKQQTTTA